MEADAPPSARWSDIERPRAAFAVAAFGVFVAADDLLVVSTMLRPIINDLGLVLPDDLDIAAWIVNVYLIAYLAVMPLAGRLSDAFGRRRVFVTSLVVFAIGSIIVPTADSLAWLLVGRALTALGGGALVPVALGLAGDAFLGRERAQAFGLLGAIETMGWIWGPIYGALLVRFLSWEWQFYLNLPLAAIGIVVGWRHLPTRRHSAIAIDWPGAVLLTVALVGSSVALLSQARIQSVTGLEDLTGPSEPVVSWPIAATIGLVAALAFAWRQSTAAQPLLDLSFANARRRREPYVAMAINTFFGAALVTALVNVPLFVNVTASGVEQGAVRSGWLLSALTAAMAVCSYLGGSMAGRAGLRRPTALGFALALAGFVGMGLTWNADSAPAEMAIPLAIIGAGLGLAMTPTTTGIVEASGEASHGSAAGLVIVFRMIGFSIGLAALTTYGVRRYDAMRAGADVPPITDPGYAEAVTNIAQDLTTRALAETFLGAGVAVTIALVLSGWLPDRVSPTPRD